MLSSLKVGFPYWVETVKFVFTGRVIDVTLTDIVLDHVAMWGDVDDKWCLVINERCMQSESTNDSLNPLLPHIKVQIPRSACVYSLDWVHELPTAEPPAAGVPVHTPVGVKLNDAGEVAKLLPAPGAAKESTDGSD